METTSNQTLGLVECEIPTGVEMAEGLANLEANGNHVDFIIFHCCAASTQVLIGGGIYEQIIRIV